MAGPARLWWTEKRGDRRALERLEPGALQSAPEDGSCRTRPAVVSWLATRFGPLLARQRRLGLPAPAPDTGMPWTWGDPSRPDARVFDGGTPALDVYLSGENTGFAPASTQCVYWFPGKNGFRAAAYVQLNALNGFIPREQEQADLEHDVLHELVHVSQCAIWDRRRETTATLLSEALVEGTAEAFAMASGAQEERQFLENAKRRSFQRVLAAEAYGYAQWPFWLALLGAPSAKAYTALLRDAVKAPPAVHRAGDGALVYARFGEAAVQRALLRHASFVLFGGELAGVRRDVRKLLPFVLEGRATLAPAAGRPATARVTLAPGAYGYVVVAAPPGSTTLRLTATGSPQARIAASATVGARHDRVTIAPDGAGAWKVARVCTSAFFSCASDDEREAAVFALANGRRTPLTVTVSAAVTG